MPVDPNDILIFKMRGAKAQKKQRAPALAAKGWAEPAVQAAKGPAAQTARQENRPVFAPRPEATKPWVAAPAPVAEPEPVPEQVQIPEMPVQQETPLSEDEEERLREIQNLEDMALYAAPVGGLQTGSLRPNTLIQLAGALFIANAVLFAYFILPQSSFVLGYASSIGMGAFLASLNYQYGSTLVNIALVVISAASGVLILANLRRSHLLGGTAGAMLLLILSYEYLNSSAPYLLLVTIFSFVSIAALVYARMSAVVAAEGETQAAVQINWPRIETF